MKKIVWLFAFALIFSSCSSTQLNKAINDVVGAVTDKPVTEQEIGMGLKEALTKGIVNGVNLTSKKDGYFKNASIKIPFPKEADKIANTLRDIGLGKEVDKVVLSLNRAAEDAATAAKPIFVSAIKKLTFKDAMKILKGGGNEATEFLKRTTSSQLRTAFQPKISTSLKKVNATKNWGDIVNRYNKIPLVKKQNPDLEGYVTDQALKGLFTMVAKEESKIRENPVARTTDLLKRVFGLLDQ